MSDGRVDHEYDQPWMWEGEISIGGSPRLLSFTGEKGTVEQGAKLCALSYLVGQGTKVTLGRRKPR